MDSPKPSAARRQLEQSRVFRKLVKRRTGSQVRISHLKHRSGQDRAPRYGLASATTWCGFEVLAHNTIKICQLIEAHTSAGQTAR